MGPRDHGRPLTLEAFRAGDYEEGYRYELIDGKVWRRPIEVGPGERYTTPLLPGFKLVLNTRT